MLHSIFAPENTNLVINWTTHLLISMSTQTIWLISSRHCQITFQNKSAIFHPIKQHLIMPHLSITTYCLRVGTKKILLVDKIWQRKIIWFNPPYSLNVETNIGKTFLKLIDKYFLKTNKFHKIFNRNNVKVSYSGCLPNFANMIKLHNNRILSEEIKIHLNVIVDRKILVFYKDIV